MIMVHASFKAGIYKQLAFLGGFAPVPFYAVAGVTAGFQAQRYPPRPVILNYLFLFLIGFALNGFNSPDYLRPPVIHFDIIQIIALGSLTVYLLEYYLRPAAPVYLVLAVVSFLIKLGLDIILPVQDHPLLAGILLPYSGTFPIFPWLFLFFLGVYAYRLSLSWELGWALLLIGTYFLLSRAGFELNYRSKYDMSTGYFLLSCILLFGMFLAARGIAIFRRASALVPLTFLGRNSLLFLFVHFSAIAFFSLRLQWNEEVRLFTALPFTYWLFILLVVLIAMAVLLRAAQVKWLETIFDRIWAWIALILLIVAVAAVIPHNGLVRWIEAGLGILAALYYHRLARALKPGRPAPVS
jgi:hypothetical protein